MTRHRHPDHETEAARNTTVRIARHLMPEVKKFASDFDMSIGDALSLLVSAGLKRQRSFAAVQRAMPPEESLAPDVPRAKPLPLPVPARVAELSGARSLANAIRDGRIADPAPPPAPVPVATLGDLQAAITLLSEVVQETAHVIKSTQPARLESGTQLAAVGQDRR